MDGFGVIVVAAGKGTRMGTAESKQYLLLEGKPILVHTLETFERMPEAQEVVLVVGEHDVERCRGYAAQYGLAKARVVPGGAERQHSVLRGLEALSEAAEWVLVHDGVRPFVREDRVRACWRKAMETSAAVLAVPVKDTIKVLDGDGVIVSTPDRRTLWAIQTPQAFRRSVLEEAHRQAERDGVLGTDDAMLVERLGLKVHVVESDYTNIKITTPEDLAWAAWLVKSNGGAGGNMIRVGQGFDVHQLAEGRKCIIGGVDIPFEKGLLGHSDADVLLHAISDAILGALGLGDIGKHFPDTDEAFKDADSLVLLKQVWKLARERGYKLGNLDSTIIAQRPKMAPYIPQMAEIIAGALEAETSQVNVKATTTEKLGFAGREEGIAAQAVVCLVLEGGASV